MFRKFIDFEPKVIFEIGVGLVRESRSKPYWEKCHCHLFEPLYNQWFELEQRCKKFPKVELHQVAIWKEDGEVDFVMENQASFIQGINSPEIQHKGEKTRPTTTVTARTIDHFDKGDIDILLLDTEGAEYYVLEKLKSRPKFISVETHLDGIYTNPFLKEIQDWMKKEGYKKAHVHGSDTYYVI